MYRAIGIIVMYRAQKQRENELSRAEWAAPIRDLIKIETVDAYQGRRTRSVAADRKLTQ